ncbi:hypothetical protein [Streptomyces sp. DSM 15324]|nr:hypothetical protein [Streptomyces sp. DSM 15324]
MRTARRPRAPPHHAELLAYGKDPIPAPGLPAPRGALAGVVYS